MEIIRLVVGALSANCYLVYDEASRESLIIDPGDDAGLIIDNILRNDLSPKLIIATHAHYDHVLAVTELKLAFGILFALNPKDKDLLKNAGMSAKYFNKTDSDPVASVETNLLEGGIVKIKKVKLRCFETPGHTPGSVVLYSKEEKVCFAGDLVFSGGYIGRSDFSYSNHLDLKNSVNKLLQLPGDTTILSGHGEAFLLSSFAKNYTG